MLGEYLFESFDCVWVGWGQNHDPMISDMDAYVFNANYKCDK